MSEILTYVITSLITFLTTGGIGSIFYFKLQKRTKEAEVRTKEAEVRRNEAEAKAAEVDIKTREINNLSSSIQNLSASNEEWIRLYNNCQAEKEKLEKTLEETTKRFDEIYKTKENIYERYMDCKSDCNKKDMVINELNWYRCEVNGCPYRKPPRRYGEMDFPKDAVSPIEHPDPDYI